MFSCKDCVASKKKGKSSRGFQAEDLVNHNVKKFPMQQFDSYISFSGNK